MERRYISLFNQLYVTDNLTLDQISYIKAIKCGLLNRRRAFNIDIEDGKFIIVPNLCCRILQGLNPYRKFVKKPFKKLLKNKEIASLLKGHFYMVSNMNKYDDCYIVVKNGKFSLWKVFWNEKLCDQDEHSSENNPNNEDCVNGLSLKDINSFQDN